MSIRIMSAVWSDAPYDGGVLLVLLALADYANDEGECWPHVRSIAKKARLTERQTYNILRQLKRDRVLAVQFGGGRHKSSQYTLNVETLKQVSLNSSSVKSDSLKSATENPEICDSSLLIGTVKEPSINPPYPLSSKGGLNKRDLRRLSKELDRIYGASVGANFDSSFEDRALRTACARLLIPLDQARAAVDASCGALKVSGGLTH